MEELFEVVIMIIFVIACIPVCVLCGVILGVAYIGWIIYQLILTLKGYIRDKINRRKDI